MHKPLQIVSFLFFSADKNASPTVKQIVKILRILRVMRPLKSINKLPKLKVSIISLLFIAFFYKPFQKVSILKKNPSYLRVTSAFLLCFKLKFEPKIGRDFKHLNVI